MKVTFEKCRNLKNKKGKGMIQLREKLQITGEEFMYVVRNSVFEDAKACGMEGVLITDVKDGMTYYKTLNTVGGRETKVKTFVNCFKHGLQYSATITSGSGEYAITYMVEEVEDGIFVEYTEADSYQKTLRKWNSTLVGMLRGKKQRKNIIRMLKAMESYILENRSEINRKNQNMKSAEEEIASSACDSSLESEE